MNTCACVTPFKAYMFSNNNLRKIIDQNWPDPKKMEEKCSKQFYRKWKNRFRFWNRKETNIELYYRKGQRNTINFMLYIELTAHQQLNEINKRINSTTKMYVNWVWRYIYRLALSEFVRHLRIELWRISFEEATGSLLISTTISIQNFIKIVFSKKLVCISSTQTPAPCIHQIL